jgi:hypothetical protein
MLLFLIPPPQISSYWSSGLPWLDATPKSTSTPWDSGLQLPLFLTDVSEIKSFISQIPEAMWTQEEQARSNVVMTGRTANMQRFKPGVDGIVLLFSDQDGRDVYKFPYYDVFAPLLEPLLVEVSG